MPYRNRNRQYSSAIHATLLGLAVAGSTHSFAQDDPQAASLPSGDVILKQCVEAMGGPDALDSIESAHAVMHAEITGLGRLDFDISWAKGGKLAMTQKAETGSMRAGSDGKTHWMFEPTIGYQLMPAEQWAMAAGQFRMLMSPAIAIIQLQQELEALETLGIETFNDAECYKVHITNKDGQESDAFFDTSTKLLAGFANEEQTQLGPTVVEVYCTDHKAIDPIVTFTRLTINQGGMKFEIVYDTIEFNTVPASTFALPEEIQARVGDASDDTDGIDADDVIDDVDSDDGA